MNLFPQKRWLRQVSLALLLGGLFSCSTKTGQLSKSDAAQLWLTTADKTVLFQKQATALPFLKSEGAQSPVIEVDDSQTFQSIDGFGYTLTGGSAYHLHKVTPGARAALLKELFATDGTNIGISYLRVSIGASDLDEKVFSYNDLPEGQTDPNQEKFSLAPDRAFLIPVLKEILAINPDIMILGSPWSPPTWMKTNQNSKGGSLEPKWYDAYAKYFVKYVQEMAKEGIKIDAITVQNEPLHPGNNPSLLMLPQDQAIFVKNHLGPSFQKAGVKTKIIIYDHNLDRPDYPISILNDPEAKKYIDGSAFHLYGGKIEAMADVHNAHPDKNVYFTEQWIGAPGNFPEDMKWHVRELIIGATRNWARNVLEWNLAADPQQRPFTPGGCNQCLGAITVNGDQITRNPAYYVIAHASKFVRPGSVRIGSNVLEGLPNVAFKTPKGERVVVVLNNRASAQTFQIKQGDKSFSTTLPVGAVGTYVW
ncbi:glucosylceramidase [Rufibacter sp. DG15C]|uniref:glycoside hydrolase family 30 protein n=1 Tax=Rufibacter sp. DG15C TaxID=1379909 RepID=UPI00078C983A|nr:glycoside hydrolase family 30 beta sandwich domain-containing protein [Rufibacter sp. DG15C]AMM50702.1 glucosylceramidase [Rufibacter sp. DG15C]